MFVRAHVTLASTQDRTKALAKAVTRVEGGEVLPPCGHFLKLQQRAACPHLKFTRAPRAEAVPVQTKVLGHAFESEF